jgi:Spy/CpxP family protein refolding chaperone
MMSFVSRRLPLVVTALLVTLGPRSVVAQPLMWWKVDSTVRELGLTADQSARLETVFQENITQLRQRKDELDRHEAKLSRMIETNADEATVTTQIDRVETTRAALNKTRTLMLLHMRQLLTPDQRAKLNDRYDAWDRQRRNDNNRNNNDRRDGRGRDNTPRTDTPKD